jgi:hypothetical protein
MKGLPENFIEDADDKAQNDRQQDRTADREIETEILFLYVDIEWQIAEPSEPPIFSRPLSQHDEHTDGRNRCTEKNEHSAH